MTRKAKPSPTPPPVPTPPEQTNPPIAEIREDPPGAVGVEQELSTAFRVARLLQVAAQQSYIWASLSSDPAFPAPTDRAEETLRSILSAAVRLMRKVESDAAQVS